MIKKLITSLLFIVVIISGCGGGGGNPNNSNPNLTTLNIEGTVSQVFGTSNLPAGLSDPITAEITYNNTEYSEIGNYPQGNDSFFKIRIGGQEFASELIENSEYFDNKKFMVYVDNNNENVPVDFIWFYGAKIDTNKVYGVDEIHLRFELSDTTMTAFTDRAIPLTIEKNQFNNGRLRLLGYNVIRNEGGVKILQGVWGVDCLFNDFQIK